MKVRTGVRVGKSLGDLVAKACQITGIANSAKKYEAITGKSCDCDKRKAILDKIQLG